MWCCGAARLWPVSVLSPRCPGPGCPLCLAPCCRRVPGSPDGCASSSPPRLRPVSLHAPTPGWPEAAVGGRREAAVPVVLAQVPWLGATPLLRAATSGRSAHQQGPGCSGAPPPRFSKVPPACRRRCLWLVQCVCVYPGRARSSCCRPGLPAVTAPRRIACHLSEKWPRCPRPNCPMQSWKVDTRWDFQAWCSLVHW